MLLHIGKRKAPLFTEDKNFDMYSRTCVNEVHRTYVFIMLWFYTKAVKQKRETIARESMWYRRQGPCQFGWRR